ncbi:MAG: hypothetical protein KDB68_07605 [Planctomycetes bacterium]|nr:hypothetical protein [Planctomycetota bacterium]
MKRRPNVRYRAPRTQPENQETKPSDAESPQQNAEPAKHFDSDSLRKLLEETSQRLFEDFGGKSLERRVAQHEASLDVYQQDLDRTMVHNEPDKFRWRIKPAESIRIGREIDALTKQITELRERTWQMAKETVEGFMYEQHMQQQAMAETQTAAAQPEAQNEASVAHGQTQPRTTPTESSAHHEAGTMQAPPNRPKPVAA